MRISLLFLSAFFFFQNANAQGELHPCGTQDGKVQWLLDYQAGNIGYPENEDTLYVPMTIHVVGNDNGGGYFDLNSILNAFCVLNQDFEESKIQFYIAGLNYIANTVYYDHTFAQGAEMMEIYRVPATINTYIVSSPAGNCGYSSYNLGVALAKNCTGPNDHTWAHEIGHFLSLPHPFWGWEGTDHNYNEPAPLQINNALVERLDGVDCHIAGDGFCDTEPDYLNFRWPCNGDNFSNQQQTDPNGETFYSDGSLFMSYAADNCMSRFSVEQQEAMRANLLTEKADHLQSDLPDQPFDASEIVLVTPAEGAFVEFHKNVTFEWEPLDNATGYFLEITIFEGFNTVLFRYDVEGTNFIVPSLPKNRLIYWRVRPYNLTYTCESYSNEGTFETGDLVSGVAELESITELTLQPNPVTAGGEVQVQLSSTEQFEAEVAVMDVAGQVLQYSLREMQAGANQLSVSTEGLAPGLYLLQVRSERGVLSEKFVVQ